MSSRIDSNRLSSISHEELDVPATVPTAQPSRGDAVEAFKSSNTQPEIAREFGAEPGVSASELASQQQKLQRSHQLLTEGFASVKPQLDEAVNGGSMLALTVRLSSSPQVDRMLSEVPRELVEKGIEAMVRDARPSASPREVGEFTKRISADIDERLRTDVAQKLRKSVSSKLEQAATQLERDSKDPKTLATMTSQLAKWESPSATNEQKALAVSARDLLGLGSDTVTPERLSQALQSRAALVRDEANNVHSAGETTLYRSLALHSAAAASLLKAEGIKPDSWAAEGLASVKAKAARDDGDLSNVKTASNMALGFIGGAMGWNKATSAVAPIALNAGALANSYQHIDRARAGALAGTSSDDMVSTAKLEFRVEAAEVGLASALAGWSADGKPSFQHANQHAVSEAALADTAHAVEHWLHPHASGAPSSTMNALRGNE